MYKWIHMYVCLYIFIYLLVYVHVHTYLRNMHIRMYIFMCSCYKNLLLCGGGPFIRDGESTQWMMPLIVVESCPDLQLASIAL